jgi:hypothetical protein
MLLRRERLEPPMSQMGQTRLIDKLPTLAACLLRPESDRRRSKCGPPLCANRVLMQRSKKRPTQSPRWRRLAA